jgi:hypothetical protein
MKGTQRDEDRKKYRSSSTSELERKLGERYSRDIGADKGTRTIKNRHTTLDRMQHDAFICDWRH